jgi:hypothetical protein
MLFKTYSTVPPRRLADQAEARAAAAAAAGGAGCLTRVAYAGAYGIIVVELAVAAGESFLIGYHTGEAWCNRSQFLEMSFVGAVLDGYDAPTARRRAQDELDNLDKHSPGFWSLYGEFFYHDYIGWWY